jgi:hypothetical protein
MTNLTNLSEDELLGIVSRILATPGRISQRDVEQLRVVNEEFKRRSKSGSDSSFPSSETD